MPAERSDITLFPYTTLFRSRGIDQVRIAEGIEGNTRKKTPALEVERRRLNAIDGISVKGSRAAHDGVVVGIGGPCHFRRRVIYLLPERRQQVSPVHSVVE